jgi:tetratricopeptide (TPR) repeat protein
MHTFDVTRAESNYKGAVAEDPNFTRAWLHLAVLYVGLGATNDAISTLEKAVNSDPSLPISHRILAFSLMSLNRSDRAMTAWLNLLKVVPDDRDAKANLGILLLREKRYGDAIPYLEATAQNYPSTEAQHRLGYAYLQAGQIEKGSAALEKVIEADPTPQRLNNVAYELAEANADLANALKYAQRAVSENEKKSGGVQLAKLQTEDLACTQSIGNAWDTLGWVQFRLGHLDQAESYIHAAWLLSQASVVGDHLGQVYEQEKKTEKAIHVYRLALAVPEPPGGSRDETRQRLQNLTRTKIPTGLDRGGSGAELSRLRSVKLKRVVAGSATAEFFLLFAPGPKVESVGFVSGSEKLKTAAISELSQANFQIAFPEGSGAHLLRRAILACSSVSGCEAVLLTPDSVKSIK